MSDRDDSPPQGPSAAPKTRAPSRLAAVSSAGTVPRTLAANHLADLQRSGLSEETIALAGVYSESENKKISDLLGWSWRNGSVLVFPFRDYDSRSVIMSRVKPDKPRLRPPKNKPIKYEQAPGTGAVPFFGPRTINEQRLDDPKQPILWTEGEKKTCLLDQLGYAVFGLTGCHNFNDGEKYREGDGLTWAPKLRKYAERFVKGRNHIIVYDSDAFENENVMLAMQRLAGLLLHDGAATVRYVRIPSDSNDKDKHVGIDDFFVGAGEEQTRFIISSARLILAGEEIAPIPPRDPLAKLNDLQWLRSAKLHTDLRLPPRFEVRRDRSLWYEPPQDKGEDAKEIMRGIIIPTAILASLDETDSSEQRVEIVYFARDSWRAAIVDRRALRDSRRALSELPADCAISSNNASLVVSWFDEYMRCNEHRMELRRFAGECGWHNVGSGHEVFMLNKPVSIPEAKLSIEPDSSGDRARIIDAFKPRGSLLAHTDAINEAFKQDSVAALAILASLAAPLLRPLNAPNFGLHLSGDSSRGKTSKLVCAASVYGNPRNDHWLGSWHASPAAIELRASTLCDLPLCFDEIGAGDRYAIDRTIYMLINGSGKSRAERSLALRKTPTWRTVVLSTGEHELAPETANTGAQVRIIQFRVNGFGKLDAKGVDDIREACERNYGQVGRKWIDTLMSIEDWQPYHELFAKAKDQFRSKEAGSLMQRQAVYYALLAVTEHLASQSLGIGKKGGATIRELFTGSEKREVKTVGDRSLEVLIDNIVSMPDVYPQLIWEASGGLQTRVKASVKQIRGVRHRGTFYLIPELLRELLEASGLSYKETLASWKERDYLECDDGRDVKRVRWDGRRLWVVAVKYTALGIDADSTAQTNIGEKTAEESEKSDYGE